MFGGLLVAQAIAAAHATVPTDFYVYSSQSSWLRPVSAKAQGKATYHVERTADGRSYATRLVRAIAAGACVYVAIVSFQHGNNMPSSNNNVLTYNIPMPALDVQPKRSPRRPTRSSRYRR